MSTAGRPRRPDHLKLISGTDRPDRREPVAAAPTDPVLDLPPAPDWLPNDFARAEWDRMVGLLVPRGALDEIRLSELGRYCALHGSIVQAYKAGTHPTADSQKHCDRMLRGFIGTSTQQAVKAGETAPPANRFAKFKSRAEKLD